MTQPSTAKTKTHKIHEIADHKPKTLAEETTEKKNSWKSFQVQMTLMSNKPTRTRESRYPWKFILAKERKKIVTSRKAFVRVRKDEVSPGSSTFGLHLVYHRKSDGSPKARNVSWWDMETERDDVDVDALSLNLDSTRLLIALAAENGWDIWKIDVKTAQLQAKWFQRDVFVSWPRKENENNGTWKLFIHGYGPTKFEGYGT